MISGFDNPSGLFNNGLEGFSKPVGKFVQTRLKRGVEGVGVCYMLQADMHDRIHDDPHQSIHQALLIGADRLARKGYGKGV